jgi:hypothetical protein
MSLVRLLVMRRVLSLTAALWGVAILFGLLLAIRLV